MSSHPEASERAFAVRFQDQSVVERYHLRPDYPAELFAFLRDLIVDEPRVLLDVGCGLGNISRSMPDYVERIDAVDLSAQMLERARTLPRGDSAKIRWLQGKAEEVELTPPYALITAGRSMHWFDWDVILPRFAQLLTPNGMLAIVQAGERNSPWRAALREIIERYSANSRTWHRNMAGILQERHLFQREGQRETAPVEQQQTLADYIEGLHSRSGLSLDILGPEATKRFDAEVHELLTPYAQNGVVTVSIIATVVWGKPLAGQSTTAGH